MRTTILTITGLLMTAALAQAQESGQRIYTIGTKYIVNDPKTGAREAVLLYFPGYGWQPWTDKCRCNETRQYILARDMPRVHKFYTDMQYVARQRASLRNRPPVVLKRIITTGKDPRDRCAALLAAGDRKLLLRDAYDEASQDKDGFVRQAAARALTLSAPPESQDSKAPRASQPSPKAIRSKESEPNYPNSVRDGDATIWRFRVLAPALRRLAGLGQSMAEQALNIAT